MRKAANIQQTRICNIICWGTISLCSNNIIWSNAKNCWKHISFSSSWMFPVFLGAYPLIRRCLSLLHDIPVEIQVMFFLKMLHTVILLQRYSKVFLLCCLLFKSSNPFLCFADAMIFHCLSLCTTLLSSYC